MPRKKGSKYHQPTSSIPKRVSYTTGQVARMMGIAPRTITKLDAAGHIKSYRIPESLDRRYPASEVYRFLIANNCPIPDFLLSGGRNVAFALPAEEVPTAEPFRVEQSPVVLGAILGQDWPVNLFVAGDDLGLSIAVEACLYCRRKHPAAKVVLCLSPDVETRKWPEIDFVFRRPVHWEANFAKVVFPTPAGVEV